MPEPPEDAPPSPPIASAAGGAGRDRDQQIAAILEIIGNLVRDQRRLEGQFNRVVKLVRGQDRASEGDQDQTGPHTPAPWVWYSPPAADEPEPGEQDFDEDPQVFVTNFVAWYNTVFVGVEGGRAVPIPACWDTHAGLAMEVASLAYSWRTANLGPTASIREAQYWLHQFRPGFADRLIRDWVHSDCRDGQHQPTGAHPRANRFTVNHTPPPAAASPPQASPPAPPVRPGPPSVPPAGWNRP